MYGMCTEYDNFCQIHLDRYNALCKSYFAKYVLCVDTCLYYFFHHQILYGLTDYGVKLSSNCKEPELYI